MSEVLKIATVAKYTFAEIYKSKILINTLVLSFVLMLMTYVASELSYEQSSKIALDFGLGITSIAGIGIAIFLGVTLLSKEIESRTIYMIISRPISRSSFLLGKIVGLSGILVINYLIMSALTLSIFIAFDGKISGLIIWSVVFSFIESIIVLQIVVFISLISNAIISVLGTITIYILGHGISHARDLPFVKNRPMMDFVISVYGKIFPDFSLLNIKNFVLYDFLLKPNYLLTTTAYAIFYIVCIFLLSIFILSKKDLN